MKNTKCKINEKRELIIELFLVGGFLGLFSFILSVGIFEKYLYSVFLFIMICILSLWYLKMDIRQKGLINE